MHVDETEINRSTNLDLRIINLIKYYLIYTQPLLYIRK